MRRRLLILFALALAGCAQPPLTPEDLQARKFESVLDKGVIYVVRDAPDFSDRETLITLGDKLRLTTYKGTYYRWEVPPGKLTIAGYAGDSGTITVQVERGRIYYVVQSMTSMRGWGPSRFNLVDEQQGRALVLRSVLLTAQ